MKKLLIVLLTTFISNEQYKKTVRFNMKKFKFSMFKEFIVFKNNRVKDKTVLVFEPNGCHAEVIVGYTKYLYELGYKVDILTTRKNIKSKFFNSFLDNQNIKLFTANEALYKAYLKSKKIKEYEFVWIMSSKYYINHSKNTNIVDYLGFTPIGKNKTIFTIHDTADFKKEQLDALIPNNQIVSLATFTKGVMVNPHYFCDYEIYPKNKITTFITIGEITNARRNYNELFSAIRNLISLNHKFKIVVISRSEPSGIPEDILSHIVFKRNLNYPDMYKEIINSDFFLPLLDPDNKEHERYITTGATGSTQLIYGFSKPCLIHQKFAPYYMLDETNSIIYKDDFLSSMLSAIKMEEKEYSNLQKNITQTSSKIKQISIKNLKTILSSF